KVPNTGSALRTRIGTPLTHIPHSGGLSNRLAIPLIQRAVLPFSGSRSSQPAIRIRVMIHAPPTPAVAPDWMPALFDLPRIAARPHAAGAASAAAPLHESRVAVPPAPPAAFPR